MRYVAIIGPSEATDAERAAARTCGQWLAEREAVVITGGHGGVMAAAVRGVHERDGICVGLLPGSDRSGADAHLTVSLPTGLGELRNGLIVRAADVILAIGGSWGTMSEIALAVRTGVPVISFAGWNMPADGVTVATSLDEALEAVWTLGS
ncbi:MAG: TIGR00725 family protein [Nocardioidaceae bacterium]